jgi:two-component system sensor histidine kinase BaeS
MTPPWWDAPPESQPGPTPANGRHWHGRWQHGSWHRGRAPWMPGQHGEGWNPHRKKFLVRFISFFVLMLLLVIGGMAMLALLVTRLVGGGAADDFPTVVLVWIVGCGLALGLPLLAIALAARAFRSYAIPLADIMDAAESVAQGDFTARVQERGSPEFRRLAHSFNRMTEELGRTDQQRRNLTADVAHELRTPLHIIQGNLEGILDGVYEPTPEHIEATLQETRALARLVDDLRTLSLAESGALPLQREPVDVQELLEDVATSFAPQAEAAGIDLRVQCINGNEMNGNEKVGAPAPITIEGDVGRLDQALSNLAANAIRHTPAGGQIVLAAHAENGRVLVTVADTGEGIPEQDLPFIFDRFWKRDPARSHSSGAKAHPGSGLGLAITAYLVKAHDGDIRVASEVGKGTTFTIDLPAFHGTT